jgi:hypothetical protein
MEKITVTFAEWTGEGKLNRVPIDTKLPEGEKLGKQAAKHLLAQSYKEHKYLMDKTTKHRLQVISYQYRDFTIYLS